MHTIRVPDRTATPEEWAEESRRIQAAREQQRRRLAQPEETPDIGLHATHGKNGRPELQTVRP
jgi:response regulator of citrate/malate metabolism